MSIKVVGLKSIVQTGCMILGVMVLSFACLALRPTAHTSAATNGKIAYVSEVGGTLQVFTANPDGSDRTQLTTGANDTFYPSWSPDGSKIVYSYDTDGNGDFQLFSMNADGSDQTQLTSDGNIDLGAVWSPNGTKIAFAQQPSGGGSTRIFVMNANGTDETQVSSNASNDDEDPSWNPNGLSLAFSCQYTKYQICTVNADGTNQVELTNNTSSTEFPSWSPDGTQIAYVTIPSNYDQVLSVMNANGTGSRTITTDGGSTPDVGDVTWSPDGTKLLFDDDATSPIQVRYINTDGTGQTVVSDPTIGSITPSWQPIPVPDIDGDGVSNAIENAGPNGGDANDDGIPDEYQPQVTSLPNPVSNTYTVVQSNCTSNSNVSISASPSSHPDNGYSYPEGLTYFTLNCPTPGMTATVTLYYYGLTPNNTMSIRKYNSTTHAYQAVPGATITSTTIAGQQVTKVTYQITDGGPLDQDGTANGVIVDPVGIALPSVGLPDTGLGGTAR